MTEETGPENYINSKTDTVTSTQAWMLILIKLKYNLTCLCALKGS